MRALSQVSHSRIKAAWITLAAASLAGLAILGACSEGGVSKVAGPRVSSPRYTLGSGITGATSHLVKVCVDPLSDPGPGGNPFTFTVAAMSEYAPPFPWFERDMTAQQIAAEQAYATLLGFTQNAYGPWHAGGDNDVVTLAPSTTPGNCAIAFQRLNTCPLAGNPPVPTCQTNPDPPSQHPGNRFQTDNSGTLNPAASVSIAAVVPSGYTFTLSCTNDDPFAPINCIDGGYASANVFHGSVFTYKFTAPEELPCPAGTFTPSIASAISVPGFPDGSVGDLLIKYDQFPAPNDNSYGVNSIGWNPKRGHTFKDLVNSDHAGVLIKNASNQLKLSFNMDYLTAFAAAPSGYKSLGVTGGDGGMLTGTSTGIQVTTSLANNLNNINIPNLFNPVTHVQANLGTNVLENSPPTDPAHQTYVISDSDYAGWDFHDTYYVRIKVSGAGANPALAGFNLATWTVAPNATQLHNSPDKACPATN